MQAALKTGDEVQAQSLEEAGSGTRPRLLKGRLEILRRPAQDPYPAFTAFFVNGQEASVSTIKKLDKAELALLETFSNDCHDEQGKFCGTGAGAAKGPYDKHMAIFDAAERLAGNFPYEDRSRMDTLSHYPKVQEAADRIVAGKNVGSDDPTRRAGQDLHSDKDAALLLAAIPRSPKSTAPLYRGTDNYQFGREDPKAGDEFNMPLGAVTTDESSVRYYAMGVVIKIPDPTPVIKPEGIAGIDEGIVSGRFKVQKVDYESDLDGREVQVVTIKQIADYQKQADAQLKKNGWDFGPDLSIQASAATTPTAAGLAVVAQDTGRVLMLQRALSDNDQAGGKWEFPGGTLDPNETPKEAATREWSEETGASLPEGTHTGTWTSPNGVYQGFVYTIKQESDLPINLDHEDRNVLNPDDPDGDQIETVAWWAPEDLRNNPALRDEAHSTDWDVLQEGLTAALTSLDLTLFNRLFEFYNANHDERGRFTANGGSKAERNIPVTPFRDEDKEFDRVAQLEKHYGRKEMAPEMGGPQWAFEGGSPPITEAAKDVLQGYPYDHYDNYRAYDHASYQAADTILHTIEHESSDVPLYSGHKRGRDAVQAMIEEGVEFPLVATSPDRKLADAYAGKGSTLADSPVAVVFEFPKGSQAGFYQANESIATGTYKVASHEWSNDETKVTLQLQQTKRVTVPEKTYPEED